MKLNDNSSFRHLYLVDIQQFKTSTTSTAMSDGRLISARIDSFTWLGRGSLLGVFNSVRLMVIFALVLRFLLTRTTFGRRAFSVGGNEQAAAW